MLSYTVSGDIGWAENENLDKKKPFRRPQNKRQTNQTLKTIYYPTFIHPSTFFFLFFFPSFLVKEFFYNYFQPLFVRFCPCDLPTWIVFANKNPHQKKPHRVLSGSQRLACDHYTTNNSQIWLTRDWKIFLRVCSSLFFFFAGFISPCCFVVALRKRREKNSHGRFIRATQMLTNLPPYRTDRI